MTTLTLQGATRTFADTMLYKLNPNNNYGQSQQTFYIGLFSGDDLGRIAIKFELSELPDDAAISSAVLTFYVQADYASSGPTLSVYRLKRNWIDGEATWNIYSTGNSWSSAGAFHTDDCEQTDIGSGTFAANLVAGDPMAITLDVISKDELDLGYGFLVKSAEAATDMYSVYSSEWSTLAQCPKLVIEYTTNSTTLILQPDTADTTLEEDFPTSNFSGFTGVDIGLKDVGKKHRALMKFDLSSLPSNATISSATLVFTNVLDLSDNLTTWSVYRLKRDWVEDQATWNVYSTGNSWQTAGASGADDREATDIGTISVPSTVSYGGLFSIALTPTTKAALDLGYGWLIQATEAAIDHYGVAARSNGTAAYKPRLVIHYTESVAGRNWGIVF